MEHTDAWMLGVGGFGLVFYLFSLYYSRRGTTNKRSVPDSE